MEQEAIQYENLLDRLLESQHTKLTIDRIDKLKVKQLAAHFMRIQPTKDVKLPEGMFTSIEEKYTKYATELFKEYKGLMPLTFTSNVTELSLNSIDLSKDLSPYFLERITPEQKAGLQDLLFKYKSGLRNVRNSIGCDKFLEISLVFDNYQYVVMLSVITTLIYKNATLLEEIVVYIHYLMNKFRKLTNDLKLGVVVEKKQEKPLPRPNRTAAVPKKHNNQPPQKKRNKFSKKPSSFRSMDNYFNFKFNSKLINKINNISLVSIPENILKLLSLGGNYCFKKPNLEQSLNNINVIEHKIRQFLNKNELFLNKNIEFLNKNIELVKTKIININNSLTKFNNPFNVVKKYLIDNDLIIKNADKNMGLTVMPKTWYNNQVLNHINDKNYYVESDINYRYIWMEFYAITNKLKKLPFKNKEFVKDMFKIPKFYIIPKLHKNPVKTRPIVPNLNWVTTEVSIWLHKKLWPYVQDCPWIAENSLGVVHKIDSLCLTKRPFVYSIDVESMYTNIDITEGLQVIKSFLTDKGVNVYSITLIVRLLSWVLRNNYFEYGNKTYKQVKGTAMGSNVAPAFANLFMLYYEINMFKVMERPLIYLRYLDDCLVVTDSEEKFFKMLEYMQKMSPSLKFTYVVCENSLNFLDLNITLKHGMQLSYSLYQKPGNRHLYLHPDSMVKPSIKFGWITGENIRLLRVSDSKKSFKKSMKLFIDQLLDTGYSQETIQKYVKYKYIHRTLVYNKVELNDVLDTKFIVVEADAFSLHLNKLIHTVNRRYGSEFCLVEKNYHKLIDELNHASAKVIDTEISEVNGNAFGQL